MSSTTRFGLPSPDGPENADVPLYLRNLANATDPWLSRSQPRTQAQINAITTPLLGQQVLNSDTNRVMFWNGTSWGNVGGSAFGTFTFPSMTVTTTPQEVSFFVGLGFQEINFSIGQDSGNGANITAVAEATKARGFYSNATGAPRVFNPATTTSSVPFSLASGNTSPAISNIRLGADGFLRFNIVSSGTSNLSAADRINWGAR